MIHSAQLQCINAMIFDMDISMSFTCEWLNLELTMWCWWSSSSSFLQHEVVHLFPGVFSSCMPILHASRDVHGYTVPLCVVHFILFIPLYLIAIHISGTVSLCVNRQTHPHTDVHLIPFNNAHIFWLRKENIYKMAVYWQSDFTFTFNSCKMSISVLKRLATCVCAH